MMKSKGNKNRENLLPARSKKSMSARQKYVIPFINIVKPDWVRACEQMTDSLACSTSSLYLKCYLNDKKHCNKTTDRKRNKYRRRPNYSIFAHLYDYAMGEAVLPTIIDKYASTAKKLDIRTDVVADVGCGTGRFLRYLSRSSTKLFGVDCSETMLNRAARNTSGKNIVFLRQDLRDLDLPEKVDCVTSTFDTVNYLKRRSDLKLAMQAFARNLKPGGHVMFDYIPEGSHRSDGKVVKQYVRKGNLVSQWRVAIDPEGRGSRVTILIRRALSNGETDRSFERHEQRWHAPADVENALREAGFEIRETSEVEPDGNGSWLHVVARLQNTPSHTEQPPGKAPYRTP